MLFERAGSSPATDTKKAPENRGFFVFPPLLCRILPEDPDHDHIAHGFGQHQHAQHGHDAGGHGHGNIEEEGQSDQQPDIAQAAVLIAVAEIEPHDEAAQQHEGHIANDTPGDVAFIGDPAVLRLQAQDDPEDREAIHGGGDGLVFLFLVDLEPQAIEEHIERRHGQGGDQLAHAQPGGKIGIDKIIEHPGHQMEGVAAAQDQHGPAHQAADGAFALLQHADAQRDGKDQIQDVKEAFSVFHMLHLIKNQSIVK